MPSSLIEHACRVFDKIRIWVRYDRGRLETLMQGKNGQYNTA